MIELMKSLDPAVGHEADTERLRALVDERLGISTTLRHQPRSRPKAWLVAAAAFLLVVLVGLPALLRRDGGTSPDLGALQRHPGVETVIGLASSGVQTAAVDGDTIWVMSSLAHQLQEVSASSGDLVATHAIEPYAEGVVTGGGFVWLLSYDNDGEVLRFDPETGIVDRSTPIGSQPGHGALWAFDSLWVSNDQGDLHRIDVEGEIVSTIRGELKGDGLGYLWVNDPDTGLISSLAEDGTLGDVVIPTHAGLDTADGFAVRDVIEAGGDLWLLDGNYPWGTNLSRFDPSTGELSSFVGITFGLLGFTEFDGYLWVASNTDHLIARIDPSTAEVVRYPLPGKVGGVFVADGSLWATVYQWGSLLRLEPDGLVEAAPVAVDDWNRFPHRLLCTGDGEADGPTIILEPYDWIDYGSWSVIQAMLSAEGHLVCVNGFVEGEASPQARAEQLADALDEADLDGPFVLASSGDGVHATRLFTEGRDDVVGMVLVDPMAVGFPEFLDELVPGAASHPPWADLAEGPADELGDYDDMPMTVIGHDPERVYLNPEYVDFFGREVARQAAAYWQQGLDFYASLSTNSTSVTASGSGVMVIWDAPDLVVGEIIDVVDQAG
ncbi:MAG TPA: hypothetical protein VI141_09055 [Acidimicrobiia bacterium]